jgi:hypothetical protein
MQSAKRGPMGVEDDEASEYWQISRLCYSESTYVNGIKVIVEVCASHDMELAR